MGKTIEFTGSYHDLSTDKGFQFEFFCGRCNSGHRTEFDAWTTGQVTGWLHTASNLFGGLFGKASQVGENVKSAQWEKAHDEHFVKAIESLKPYFIQCPNCMTWVCRAKCHNDEAGLCKNCAPDINVQMAAAQQQKTKEHIIENAQVAEENKVSAKDFQQKIKATCPKCEAPVDKNAKFCGSCGADLTVAAGQFCSNCGGKLKPGAKFCGDCGNKVG